MRKAYPIAAISIAQLFSTSVVAETEIELLKQQMNTLKGLRATC